ncbi:enoyl-CoA hydratase-related protein, partial [Tahibacter caeni]|uniref:enoyl-CoA hydratase-related protein n=1 Tax=Tahibacter caeni TaxID=1453545 RepID=UPI002147F14E
RAPQRAVAAGQFALDLGFGDADGRVVAELRGLVFEAVAPTVTATASAAPAVTTPADTAATAPVAPAITTAVAPLRFSLGPVTVGGEDPAPVPPLRDKPRGIALVNPRAVVAAELRRHQVAAQRPRIALADPGAVRSGSAGVVELLDRGDGVFMLRIDAGLNRLDGALVAALLQALRVARDAASLRVLLLEGNEQGFVRGDAAGYAAALHAGLHEAIANFPYPVIALMQGAATGAGWWLGSLCDLQLCSEEAQYGYGPDDAALCAAHTGYLHERYGPVAARQLQSLPGYRSGVQLRAAGGSCRILPAARLRHEALVLAGEIAGKSALALRLLKAHLARPLTDAVTALAPVAAGGARWRG